MHDPWLCTSPPFTSTMCTRVMLRQANPNCSIHTPDFGAKVDQDRVVCTPCELGVEKKLALCASCATTCHAGHDLVAHTKGRLTCVCGAQQRCEKLALGKVCAGHCVAVTGKPQLLFTCYSSCSCCKGCCCSIHRDIAVAAVCCTHSCRCRPPAPPLPTFQDPAVDPRWRSSPQVTASQVTKMIQTMVVRTRRSMRCGRVA